MNNNTEKRNNIKQGEWVDAVCIYTSYPNYFGRTGKAIKNNSESLCSWRFIPHSDTYMEWMLNDDEIFFG